MPHHISDNEARYIEVATRVAAESEHSEYYHGGVLVKGGSIIQSSPNKNRYCRFAGRFLKVSKATSGKEHRPTLHAELGCILGLDRSMTKGSTIYVVRVGKDGDLKLSRPCEMCEAALAFCGVRRVIYSTPDGFEKMRL